MALQASLLLALFRFNQSLWSDEAASVWFARLPFARLITQLCDPHPPGYYILLKLWMTGGESEWFLRIPSLLAALAAVVLLYGLGRQVCGNRCALLAALLLAMHPLHVWYAGEVRMYALVQALGVAMVSAGWRWGIELQDGRTAGRWGALYVVIAFLAFAADYAAVWAFILLQAGWLFAGAPRPRTWLPMQALVLASVALFLITPSQRAALQHSYHAVFLAVQAHDLGIPFTPKMANWLLRAGLIVLAALSLISAWLASRHRPALRSRQPALTIVFVLIWLALLAFSATDRLYSLKRQIIVLLPFLALAVAYYLARLPVAVPAALAALTLAVTIIALPGQTREPWRQTITDLLARTAGRETVIWVDDLAVPAFDYYLRTQPDPALAVNWRPLIGRDMAALAAQATDQPAEQWFLVPQGPYRNLIALLPAAFRSQYEMITAEQGDGIGLFHYQRRPRSLQPPAAPAPTLPETWGLLLPSPLDSCAAVGAD